MTAACEWRSGVARQVSKLPQAGRQRHRSMLHAHSLVLCCRSQHIPTPLLTHLKPRPHVPAAHDAEAPMSLPLLRCRTRTRTIAVGMGMSLSRWMSGLLPPNTRSVVSNVSPNSVAPATPPSHTCGGDRVDVEECVGDMIGVQPEARLPPGYHSGTRPPNTRLQHIDVHDVPLQSDTRRTTAFGVARQWASSRTTTPSRAPTPSWAYTVPGHAPVTAMPTPSSSPPTACRPKLKLCTADDGAWR